MLALKTNLPNFIFKYIVSRLANLYFYMCTGMHLEIRTYTCKIFYAVYRNVNKRIT